MEFAAGSIQGDEGARSQRTRVGFTPRSKAKVEKVILDLNREIDTAESERVRATSGLETPRELYETARREADQASAAFNAAKPLYDAYLAEQSKMQSNAAEVSSDADFEINVSNVVTEYQRLEAARDKLLKRSAKVPPRMNKRNVASIQQPRPCRNCVRRLNVSLRNKRRIANLESEAQESVRKAWQRIDRCDQSANDDKVLR